MSVTRLESETIAVAVSHLNITQRKEAEIAQGRA